MKKIMQILLSTLVIILLSQVLPIQIYAATRTEIQNKMIAVLYNGNGGKLSCDFDGYVNTSGRHEGIDFCASGGKGSSIYSLIDGEVTRCSNSSSLSTLAIYDATNNKTVVYLHGYYSVSVGQKISKGQYVGYESNLGATAAHTHIEVRDGRKTSAAVSVGDSTLDNSNPYSYWEKVMCSNNGYNPHGCLDSVTGGYGTITLRGWAFDQDNYNANLAIHVYVGGQGCGSLTANVFRDDVNAVYQCGNYHGFDGTVAVDRSITGKQTVHVYAINVGEGTNSLIGTKEVTILDDTESPVISNIKVSDITSTGYTVSCTVTDNNQVDRVQFPTWTEPSQDDIQYHWAESSKASGTKSGNTYTYRVNISDHNNEGGPYMTHIWAFDTYGNSVSKAISQEVYVQYTVSYNANGGTGAPSSQTKVYGTTLTLSSTKPTRTGYTFFGWSTSSSATSATYQAGGSYTANSGATLYAVWKVNTYNVSYNANGGSGAPSSQTKTYGTTLTLSSTKPTRTGYTFLGWSTSSSATSATYQAGGSYTTNSSVTLYAVWKADAYTVSYNANGGTGAPSSQTKTYGVTLTLSSTKPTRTGYTFLGWSTSSSATSATYQAGGSYTTNSSVTLYAVWKADTYTVSYNANGGTGAPSSQTKTYGVTLTLSSTKPTRTGYAFLGWSTSSSATSATYQTGGSYTSNNAVTLYAVWSANTCTIKYDANGGSGTPASQVVEKGSTIIISEFNSTRFGYTFLGWSTSASATSASYKANDNYTVNKDMTLYAVWRSAVVVTPNSTYTVPIEFSENVAYFKFIASSSEQEYRLESVGDYDTRIFVYDAEGQAIISDDGSGEDNNFMLDYVFTAGETYYFKVKLWGTATGTFKWKMKKIYDIEFDANGGVGAPNAQKKIHGEDLTLSDIIPTRTGYLGWSIDPDSVRTIQWKAGQTIDTEGSCVYYAVWEANTIIKYDANGGTGAPNSQEKNYKVPLTLSDEIPTRTGYTFLGWSTYKNTATPNYQPGASYSDDRSITLYAVWKADTYTVSYNANGGTGAPSSQTKTYGTTLTLSSTKPTRTGYTFLGWATSSSATSAAYQAGGNYTANSAVTLYAVWKADTYTVSYNANGGTGAPSSQTKTHGVALTLSSTKPTRAGYTFLGWSESSSATSTTYQAGGSYTRNSSVTLYAVWKADTYTVSYNANGGTGAPSSQIKTYGVILTLSTVRPARNGYNFLGWSTDKNAVNAQYQPGEGFTRNESVTLYAVWTEEEAKTYIVTYDANGGTGEPAAQIKVHDTELILSSIKPIRTGYTFLGWSTSSSATSATYQAGGSYTANSAVTLYAVWKADTYTVSYDANGGTGAPSSQTKTYDVILTLSNVRPVRDGYNFLGWSTDKNAVNAQYQPGEGFTGNENVTLYAVWQKERVITEIIKQPSNQTVKEGTTALFIIEANGENLRYEWYYKEPFGNEWKIIEGENSANLRVFADSSKDGYSYYCRITDAAEEQIISNTVMLNVVTDAFVNPFKDIQKMDWYCNSVMWAAENKVVAGLTQALFGPSVACSRAQIVTFLWRAEGKPKAQSRECPFEDVDRSQYYYEAMLWAVEEGIAKGYTETKFAPDVTCARAEIVTFLWRLKNKPETGTQQNPFTDVKNSDYYYKAMLWAVENKIANGYTEDTFAPYNTITRAETVALLYRLYR